MSRIAGLRKFFTKVADASAICHAVLDVQDNLRVTKQLKWGSDVNLYHSHFRPLILGMVRTAWGERLSLDSYQCPWSDDVILHLYCTLRKESSASHEMIDLLELDALVSELPEHDEAKVRDALGDILPGGEAA